MDNNQFRRAGDISLGFALVAAVVAVLSLMSVGSTAYGGSDDRGGDDRGSDSRGGDDRGGDDRGRSSDDSGSDDHGRRHGGHGADDAGFDDHGRRHGGHGADDGMAMSGNPGGMPGVILANLADVVADWEGKGYRVLDIGREDGTVVEMDVIDPTGQRLEMYVDVPTGTILRQHLED